MEQQLKEIGQFQSFDHPECAEKFTFSEFCNSREVTQKSAFINKLLVRETVDYFHCPNCNAPYRADPIEHGNAYQCTCGLKFQVYGNALYLWK